MASITRPNTTATEEEIKAAKSTIDLTNLIRDYIEQSKETEETNKNLTGFIIILTVTQVVISLIDLISK